MKTIVLIASLIILLVSPSCHKGGGEEDNSPVAKFSLSGYEVPTPTTITFINISTNASSYLWNFGDGTTSTQFNPTHVYGAAGTYMIKLDATGPGGTNTACKLLTVEAPPPTNKSAFSYYQEKCSGTPVGIAFKTLNPASTNPVWDLGNGSLSLVRDPIGQYLLPGDYTIKYSTQIGSTRDTVIRIIRID